MTHDKLSKQLEGLWHDSYKAPGYMALRAVVELHKPMEAGLCEWCTCRDCEHLVDYPCKTIQKIEMELM